MGSWGGTLAPDQLFFSLKNQKCFLALNLGCYRGFSSPPSVILVLFGTCRGCGGVTIAKNFSFEVM